MDHADDAGDADRPRFAPALPPRLLLTAPPPPPDVPVSTDASTPTRLEQVEPPDVLEVVAPVPLLPMRALGLAVPLAQLVVAALGGWTALLVWELRGRAAELGAGRSLDAAATRSLARLDDVARWSGSAGLVAAAALLAWLVVASINGRRITTFAPHWLPFTLASLVGPGLYAWGSTAAGGTQIALQVGGLVVLSIILVAWLAQIRRVASTMLHDGRPFAHWLVASICSAIATAWGFHMVRRATEPEAALTALAAVLAIDALLRVGVASLAARAVRHLRLGYDGARRTFRTTSRIEDVDRGIRFVPMAGVRQLTLAMAACTILVGIVAVGSAYAGGNGSNPDDAGQLHRLKVVAAVPAALLALCIGWWLVAVVRNASRLGRTRVLVGLARVLPWWVGLPVAVALVALDHGKLPKAAVPLAVVLALVGLARVAGIAGCTDMRYLAAGAAIAWITAAVGYVLDAQLADVRSVDSLREGALPIAPSLVALSGLLLLCFVVRIGRSLERIERALRHRKDEVLGDAFSVEAASAMFSAPA